MPTKLVTEHGGFSLIELLVSIGILVLVLSIVIGNQGSFNSAVLLRSQAYEIALTIREMQQSAVSTVNNAAVGEDFRSVLGVHFSTAAASKDRYVPFVDVGTPPDGQYVGGTDSIYGAVGLLDSRFEIDAIRYNGTDNSQVSITFARPNFDARFNTGGGLQTTGVAEIDIKPITGTGTTCPDIRTIQVTSTGQITVLEC